MFAASNLVLPALLLAGISIVSVWRYFNLSANLPKLLQQTVAQGVIIPPLENFDINNTPTHPYRPWRPGKFQMTMGLRRMPDETWLVIDKQYMPEQKLRKELLEHHRNGVLQCLPGSEAACEEVLDLIVDFLTKRYPRFFTRPGGKPEYVKNEFTGRAFKVTKPYEGHPLEIGAQLIMEDINILIKGDGEDDNHYLRASYSMAPAGWDLQERIGWPLWKIHNPVPMWNQKLLKSVEKFFYNLKADAPMERNNFFLQTNDVLFQQVPFVNSMLQKPVIEDIRLRYERQTFRRLPESGAVVFMVRTFMTPVIDLVDEPESLRNLVLASRAMPENMARYKGREVWIDTLEQWAEKILGDEYPPKEEVVGKTPGVVTNGGAH